ncbi:hypothetical protein V474_08205 [Novosphingobium barchaimii LL02]|uniref:Uncharacterized protein n=1 Tax=Novosphingobium barchaimii LL02 TaxID=1114963 RepID=A0A0J7Y9N1_9SPHN|nr:hypothetical protein [Novosphingobium barchaimii]KMS60018.1 hypothetical protein V474_08205 [Novosphingobium barchaimii LL02]
MLDTLPRTTSTVLRARPAATPRFTHPSWRGSLEPASGGGGAAIRNAGDFWSRLGL